MTKTNIGSDGKPTVFHDLPQKCFPLTITAFVGEEVIWEQVVEPYVSVEVPPATKEQKGKVRIRIRFATGEEAWDGPEE